MNSTHIHIVPYNDVKKALKSLQNYCSTGHDTLPENILKLIVESTIYLFGHIINRSIRKSIFPEQWKISKISPVLRPQTGLN